MAEENHLNHGPAITPQAETNVEQNRRQQTGHRMADQVQNVESVGVHQVSENVTATTPVIGREMLDDAKERLRTFKQDADGYVRKNPAKAVFTALAIGFVLGLMRRR
jgi:ElaB/YqjD/DUF883 family membrane-anchored ribosome-binding protein